MSILMYHQIGGDPDVGPPFAGLNVTTGGFRAQMSALKSVGFRGVSLREFHRPKARERRERTFGITFDDGFRNVFDNALPVLRELGFTATCFFVSGQIGGYNKWDADLGAPEARLMSEREMADWADAGNEIGAHTVDHVHLTELEPDEARRQIVQSRQDLETMSGREVTSFAYPYGDVSEPVRALVGEAGFSRATTTRKAKARAADDPLLLPRRNIRSRDGRIAALRKAILG